MPGSTKKNDADFAAHATDDPAGVAFPLQRLEPQVAWSLALYTVWAAVFLRPQGLEPWLLALFASLVGLWASKAPALKPAMLLARALVLLAGGFMLLLAPGTGASGAWLLWPLGLAVGYALLLPTRWACVLLVLVPASHLAAWLLAGGQDWQRALADLGALVALPATALRFGRTWRRSEREAEASRRDRRTRLYNEDGFFTHGSALFDDCRRHRRPFSLVLLSGADLRDAAGLLGRRAANELFAQMVKAISDATPSGGIAARTDRVEFAIAMPGVAADRAEALVHQRLGRPAQVEVQVAGSRAVIVLDMLTAQAPADMHTLEDLYDRLHPRLRERTQAIDTTAADPPSTLHGLLREDPQLPHALRPTVPMVLGA